MKSMLRTSTISCCTNAELLLRAYPFLSCSSCKDVQVEIASCGIVTYGFAAFAWPSVTVPYSSSWACSMPACRTCPSTRRPFYTEPGNARSHKTPTLPPLRFWASPPILPLPQKHHSDPREAKVGQTALTFPEKSSTTTEPDILCDSWSCPYND